MLIVTAFGYPRKLAGSVPEEEEEPMYASDESNKKPIHIRNPENMTHSVNLTEIGDKKNKTIYIANPENVTNNPNVTEIDAAVTTDNVTDNSTSVESNNTSEYENDNEEEYEEEGEEENENNDEIESVTPHDDEKGNPKETKHEVVDEAKMRELRRNKRKGLVRKCVYTRYVRIEDEFGCEMCTCIYEKAMMLCAPFECKDRGFLGEELDPATYSDYILAVPIHFSEYRCDRGETIQASLTCDCTCIQQDILSCPVACQVGRPLS
ncbi:uncharacterized protein LOC133531187 [Cydia pomonella]|uniref:uncharacterized protein LOC133531187 n=1 Tax=Cydia pomonella TaxID=82600 RepID=UPI002ADDC129|nr:uncharacterized protein LOC133531187 [Cydia pomonella]